MQLYKLYIFLSVVTLNLMVYANPLEEVRMKFPNFNSEKEVDHYIAKLRTDESSLAQAYLGSLYFFKSKYSVFPPSKYKFFKKGRNLIDLACEVNPKSIEIRFLRLVFQYQLPSFLGYNDDKEKDFKFFTHNYINTNLGLEKKSRMLTQLMGLDKLEIEKYQQLKQLQ